MTGAIWVLLPTYDEAGTLERVVDGVRAALAGAPEGLWILVVDDASPDGTGEIADRLAARHAEVEVLHRAAKEGLGAAYVAGFDRALAGGAGYVVEMDADLSHDPADLPRLVDAARAGADLAVGSRYVAGGGVEDWPAARRLVSRLGCWYARTVLAAPVRDLTGGFKCFRAQALQQLGHRTARSHGYAFQVELTYRALRRGQRVVEVPIVFRDRTEGRSKMTAGIALEAAWRVIQLRLAATEPGRIAGTADYPSPGA
ncbi:MAG: dolichol-phosphate mannosyltransferase [Solirubrobacteraceae bacterium]|nr:dolichol-phosphate mannosyltransferase [Solirubrobacteraceae bacterium]